MSENSNRVVVQEGYLLPFQAYRPRGWSKAKRGSTREYERQKSRRGHGRKSAGYVKQQGKMKDCARQWRARKGGGSYRAFMSGCLKSRR